MTNLEYRPRHSKYTQLTPMDNPSHRERDDNYHGVIVQLDPRWRIIECRDAFQWIIQKRSAEPLNPGYWLGASYLTDRNKEYDGLRKLAHRLDIAIIVVHRCKKSSDVSTALLEKVFGSIGITGTAETILVMEQQTGSKDCKLHVTGKDVEQCENI